MADALFRDVQADSAKLRQWEISVKLLSDEKDNKIQELEDFLKHLKNEVVLKAQKLQDVQARSEEMFQKVEGLRRTQLSKGGIQACIDAEFEELKQKANLQSLRASQYSADYESLNKESLDIKNKLESIETLFTKDKDDLLKEISEISNKKQSLISLEEETLKNLANEEEKLNEVQLSHAKELSRLECEFDGESRKISSLRKKFQVALEEKRSEAADFQIASDKTELILSEHNGCSEKIKIIEAEGEASVLAATNLLRQSQNVTSSLTDERQRIRKEIEEFKEQHQRTNQEREKEFTELESELSQLETQKFENLSIIKQHAQCKIQIHELTESTERVKIQRQVDDSYQSEEIQELTEAYKSKISDLVLSLERKCEETEKIVAEMSELEKTKISECDEETVCSKILKSKEDHLAELSDANASLEKQIACLKSHLESRLVVLNELRLQKETLERDENKMKENISNLHCSSFEGSQAILSLMNSLRSKEFEIKISKQKLEDEISCLKTKITLANSEKAKMLEAIHLHKECKFQEASLMQNFDSNCADFYKEIEKLKADIVEINDCSQSLKCKKLMLEPELLAESKMKDSDIDDLSARLKITLEKKAQFQLLFEEHEKCKEKTFELQKSLDDIVSQSSKVIGLNNFKANGLKSKHEESIDRVQSNVAEFRASLQAQKELVLKLTVDNNKLEALLGKEPSSESTVTAEKSPSQMTQLASGLKQLFGQTPEDP